MHHDDSQYLPARLALLPAARQYVTHLIQRPDDFAQSPDDRVGSRMDVLSTVLKTVKLEGAMLYNAVFSAPWSFRSPSSCLVAPYLSPPARSPVLNVCRWSPVTANSRAIQLDANAHSSNGRTRTEILLVAP